MRYAVVGYGKMGQAIDAAARIRGHRRVLVVDRRARGRGIARSVPAAAWKGVEVAFEFTEPSSARAHLLALLAAGVPVVCGTTGWPGADAEVRKAARASRAGAVIAPNFSVGMNLFYETVAEAARRYLAVGGYDPWLAEWHHRAKVDAPSGTARWIARLVAAEAPRAIAVREGHANGSPVPGALHVAAVRAGHEAGRHTVGFDGPHDAVTLEHRARGREGFAAGAVLAAEWIRGRRGIHGFDEVVDEIVRAGRRKGGRR